MNYEIINGHLKISKGVTRIYDLEFAGFDSITSVTIPDSVTSIGNWAFVFCENLATFTIPAHLESWAMENLPDTVEVIVR